MKITEQTTLSQLQAIATARGVESIRVSPDTVHGIAATLSCRDGSGVVRRGLTIASALRHAFEALGDAAAQPIASHVVAIDARLVCSRPLGHEGECYSGYAAIGATACDPRPCSEIGGAS